MKLYRIRSDNGNWGKQYNDDIEGRRIWYMPGINRCSECGQTWGSIGVAYPLVDLAGQPFEAELLKPRTVPVEQYLLLRQWVEPFVPQGLPIPPGTDFGPLIGKGTGKCGDFAWPQPGLLLVQDSAYQTLKSMDLKLPDVSVPQIKVSDKSCSELLEFQVEPRVQLAPSSYNLSEPQVCSMCGRDERKVERIVIDGETIPSHLDMFRIVKFWTYILVTEKFREVALNLGLTNVLFEEVKVT